MLTAHEESLPLGLPADAKIKKKPDIWQQARWIFWYGGMACIALVYLSIRFVDFPLARFIHTSGIEDIGWIHVLLFLSFPWGMLAAAYILYFVLRNKKPLPGSLSYQWFVVSVTELVSFALKNLLKIAFGRSWPKEVFNFDFDLILGSAVKNPSYLLDGYHAFVPFQGTKGFTAFPSGATILILAGAIPLCAMYPKMRALIVGFCIAATSPLLVTNTHFLSDIIGGVYFGLLIGWIGLAVVRKEPA